MKKKDVVDVIAEAARRYGIDATTGSHPEDIGAAMALAVEVTGIAMTVMVERGYLEVEK